MRNIRAYAYILIAATAVPLSARADDANAEALFYQAKAYMAQRKYAEACAAFEASEKLKPAATTLVSLADCREKNLQLASAYATYLQVERELRDRTDEISVEMRDLAKLRALKLEPRLSKLTVNVPASAQIGGLEVLRDNDRIESKAWNQIQIVDGGTFRISARAPDRREWSTTVTLKPEGDVQAVDVPSLGHRTVIEPKEPAPIEDVEAHDVPVESAKSSARRINRLSVGLGAAAVVLAGGAVGLELSARSVYDRTATTTDPAEQDRYWHSANRRRYVAGGLGIAALGCAGAAVYLFLDKRRSETPIATRFVPVAGAGTAGISIDGVW